MANGSQIRLPNTPDLSYIRHSEFDVSSGGDYWYNVSEGCSGIFMFTGRNPSDGSEKGFITSYFGLNKWDYNQGTTLLNYNYNNGSSITISMSYNSNEGRIFFKIHNGLNNYIHCYVTVITVKQIS